MPNSGVEETHEGDRSHRRDVNTPVFEMNGPVGGARNGSTNFDIEAATFEDVDTVAGPAQRESSSETANTTPDDGDMELLEA